jgi:hypothetical protein
MSSLVKATKKVAKGFGKAVKKVARGIGDLGKKVVSGFGKVYAKTFGKLGPLGAIAASFILPGIGGMISGMWANTAGFLGAQGGVLSAVGQGMNAISSGLSTAQGFVGKAFSSVSDKISGALTNLGGSVTKGANALFKGAQEFVGVTAKNQMSIQDVGTWVSNKAQSFAGKPQPGGTTVPFQPGQESVFGQVPTDALTGPAGQIPLAPAAGPTPTVPFGGDQQSVFTGLQTPQAPTTDITQQGLPGITSPAQEGLPGITSVQEAQKSSLLDNATKALAKTFLAGGPAQQIGALPFISSLPDQGQLGASNRGLVSGSGAGGGQFLTPEQKAFFEQERRRLGVSG